MPSAVATFPEIAARPARTQADTTLPWFCILTVLGAACIPLGALWDISWHSTIGRDTFWTPAHMLIYLGGVLPGFTCGWLALKNSFFPHEEDRLGAVRLLGFHAPIGAWVTIWGALTMLVAAPMDNWWHNAYGLDVAILSPPHTVLAAGMYAVAVGALLLVLSWQNRAEGEQARKGSLLFVFAAGVLLLMSTIILTEKSYPNFQRAATFYKLSCATYPIYLVVASRAARLRWGATRAAAVYTGLLLMMIWGLPLFKAQPLLAPIYNPVTHMVPPVFPLLLIFPAAAIDFLMIRFENKRGFWRDTLLAVLIGVTFFLLFLAIQWNFSKFLLGPSADNWFFAGNRQWPYFIKIREWKYQFWELEKAPLTISAALVAIFLAALKSRLALAFANWMSRVQR